MTREELLKIPEKRRLNDVVTLREMTREEILSIAKPILFNTDMVRAILDGRKSVTRRIAFPNKDLREFNCTKYPKGWWYKGRVYENWNNLLHDLKREKFCKYQVGDYLYVRETWQDLSIIGKGFGYGYKADNKFTNIPWRPSIHMPKEAARIFLRVTDVRVERLQDITNEQAIKEGFKDFDTEPAVVGFVETWDEITKKSDLDRYGWDANPWVWVIEFEKAEVE